MSEPIDIKPIKDKLSGTGPIFILFGPNATTDHVASTLGLFVSLKQAGKDVLIASPAEMRAEFSRLVGLDKVGKTIGNRNLAITFKNFDPGWMEKISHNDGQGSNFELVIEPKSGHKAPDPKDVEFSFRGAHADLIFVIGTSRLEDLGPIYESEHKLFSEATTVSFNRRQNPAFATISVVDNSASSLSEMIAEFIDQLELELPADAASNLLAGIDFATNRFQNPVISPSAFTTAGKLIASGARRQPAQITSSTSASPNPFGAFKKPTNPFAGALAGNQSSQTQSTTPPIQPTQTYAPPQPSPAPSPATQPAPLVQANQQTQAQPDNQKTPPKDWLEPKIYRGSTKV